MCCSGLHGPEDSQDAVFEEVQPLLTSLLDGYNVCIMAYGQTGSGKTYLMLGSQDEDCTHPDAHILNRKELSPKQLKSYSKDTLSCLISFFYFVLISEKPAERHTVEVSMVEVYNNELMDLLAKDEDGAAVGVKREVITTSTGTSEVLCLTYDIMIISSGIGGSVVGFSPIMRKARVRFPANASTPATVPSPEKWEGCVRNGIRCKTFAKLLLQCTSGVSGAALWESSCINRSLSALSDVLGALAEQRPHVPYRNSKLTHLLQDSIGEHDN
ncbi:hypothetical protein QTP70_023681 [Hemibagrus guttatus]|uniref:Kinesin motor domain-containing protein n=1 Tax=Hemibagrus guttatus TaxID=175788 RepID=A0AAE0QA78_9TELE|nr:hypothetical protein QTP70_023681 [Hemibagrus guttatus]